MKALILAAGYATRLYPLTKHYPKPLLKVGKRPMINYIVDKLNDLPGCKKIYVVTNSRFAGAFRKWQKTVRTTAPLEVIDDLTTTNENRRGAIGDMDFVITRKRITDDLLVVGGDNLFDGGLEEFFAFSKSHKKSPIIGAYDIGSKVSAKKYGVLQINQKQRIVDFQEKPARPRSTLVGMCLYYLPKERLKLLREYFNRRSHKSDATGFYIDWLRKRIGVYAHVFRGQWYDIGDKVFYNKANTWVVRMAKRKKEGVKRHA